MPKDTDYLQWIKSRFKGDNPKSSIDIVVAFLLSEAKQHTFPIKLSAVAKVIGIDPRPIYLDQMYDGSLVTKEGKIRIALQLNYRNNYRFSQRLRFTYAHELIHCLSYDLTNIPNTRIAPPPEKLEEEYLCNYGAAKLILPKKILTNIFGDEGNNYFGSSYSEKFKNIAAKADCSISTVVIDCITSGLISAIPNTIYILSLTSGGYQNTSKVKPRCVISILFDSNGNKKNFLAPNKGLEHIKLKDDKLKGWSLLRFHKDIAKEYMEVKNEFLLDMLDINSSCVSGVHVKLNDKGYVWSELRFHN